MQKHEPLEVRTKEYLSLLWVVGAAVLGCILLSGTAAVGVNDINNAARTGTATVGVVDFFISNINTAIVATVGAFSDVIATPLEVSATNTLMASPSVAPSPFGTTTFSFFPTFPTSGRTSEPSKATKTSTPRPPQTHTPQPTLVPTKTLTYTPFPTNTPIPTDTPIPPTATDVPPTPEPPTATDVPPTPEPPTATEPPTVPPDTPIPPDTPTDPGP